MMSQNYNFVKKKVIVDTDAYNEMDDQFSILYALCSRSMNVIALNAAPFANDRADGFEDGMVKSYEELMRLTALLPDGDSIPVFHGSRKAIEQTGHPAPSPAAENIISEALASEETIYILTLGAATNVASALLMDPRITEKICVIWLGGTSLDKPDVREFNLIGDYAAGQVLLNSGCPVLLCPAFDVTCVLEADLAELTSLDGIHAHGTYLAELTREFYEHEYLMMVTRKGTVKRIPFIALATRRKTGIRAITLDEGDSLINVMRTNGDDNIILATANGMAICFNENDARPMGRDAAGVRGILLGDGDYVIGAEKAEEGTTLLTVTENGFGKRTELPEYLRTGPDGEKIPQNRGGKGLKNYNITPKTGKVAGCCLVAENDDVMLIENGGVIIRVPASDINIYKRDVQGVIVMRIEEGNQLMGVQRVAAAEEAE